MNQKNNLIDNTIAEIEKSITNGQFKDCESDLIELKDLSSGTQWKSVKENVCAFLNTKGGYIICGIRERDKTYSITGFDKNNEANIIELQSNFFKNDKDVLVNLRDNIFFEYKEVGNKTLAIISVRPLSEDLKFVKFNDIYYERILTQDKVISKKILTQHKEYKTEIEYSKEISVVTNAQLQDLDVDKINQFIIKINTTGKKDTVKKDLEDALDFLNRRYCINENQNITILGLLLFGKDPSQYLENRSRVDCYFETGNEIGRDKKYLDSDILNLMDDSFQFVWGHIKIGRSYAGGGQSEPEFPEKLIREVVNNALAHRNYTINKFVTIKINPGKSIQIINPGSFKEKMLFTHSQTDVEIRRILPGVPETKNPKLANILKAFDKIESQGIGMATLVSVCLDDLIDVPYYDLSIPDTINLVIPSGKLIDNDTQFWLNSFKRFIDEKLNNKTTQQHLLVLAYLLKSERLNQKRLYSILLSPSNNHFDVLYDLKQSGLITEFIFSSTSQTPIYLIKKELTLTDFSNKIQEQTNIDLSKYNNEYIKILNIIYRYNHYNKQAVKPSTITPELYSYLHGTYIEPTLYESLGRKVRKICSDLFLDGVLVKTPDKAYQIAPKFKQ